MQNKFVKTSVIADGFDESENILFTTKPAQEVTFRVEMHKILRSTCFGKSRSDVFKAESVVNKSFAGQADDNRQQLTFIVFAR